MKRNIEVEIEKIYKQFLDTKITEDPLMFVYRRTKNCDLARMFSYYYQGLCEGRNKEISPTLTIEYFLNQQKDWSFSVFGPNKRTDGILKHIQKECTEVKESPDDLLEWIDIIILAMDGFLRHGGGPNDLLPILNKKLEINKQRSWNIISDNLPIEHVNIEVIDKEKEAIK